MSASVASVPYPGEMIRHLADVLRVPAEPCSATHVVLLLDQFPQVLGGGERVVLSTAAQLIDAGYRVSIITFSIRCSPETLAGAAAPVYLLPLSNVFGAQAAAAAWKLGCFLRRERVRIVQTYFESSNLFGGLVSKIFSDAKLIWNRRDMGILRKEKHWKAYRLLRYLPDHVIAVSEQVRQHAMEADGIPPHRISVVYNGVDLSGSREQSEAPADAAEALLPAPGTRESPLVVTIGNVRPVKGHDTLVEAAALVLQKHPEARFAIAGDPLDRTFFADLQQRVEALGISDRVFLLGGLRCPDRLLRRATLFVLPSRSEGFSNAIVEAMAAGLPVVATAVGGNAEAVKDGETGCIVPPDQPEALAASLDGLLSSPETMASMGAAGQQRVASLFTLGSMLQRTSSIYSSLLR